MSAVLIGMLIAILIGMLIGAMTIGVIWIIWAIQDSGAGLIPRLRRFLARFRRGA